MNSDKILAQGVRRTMKASDGASVKASCSGQAACNVLMIYPRFSANSFWNYSATCDLAGAQYPAAPLGLITVAALLPPEWQVRLVNRNTETLHDADVEWADMVLVGGMLPQQP